MTFRQLKESKHRFPEITQIIDDFDIMLSLAMDGINVAVHGFDIVWDELNAKSVRKNFKDGLEFGNNQIRQKGLKVRLIVEATKDNIEFLYSLHLFDIRHLEGLRGNFTIFDKRAYIVQIFVKQSEIPDQILFSNSKSLVDKQQDLFDKLWKMAIPISIRRKELEYQEKKNFKKTILGYKLVQTEIQSLMEQCKKEFLVFAPIKLIFTVLFKHGFLNLTDSLTNRTATIRILTDDVNEDLVKQVAAINSNTKKRLIHLGYTNKLGHIDEMVVVSDSEFMLKIRREQENNVIATFSNEPHHVQIQEILFEKHWNEIISIAVAVDRK